MSGWAKGQVKCNLKQISSRRRRPSTHRADGGVGGDRQRRAEGAGIGNRHEKSKQKSEQRLHFEFRFGELVDRTTLLIRFALRDIAV